MVGWKDVYRVVNGLSLVAKETVSSRNVDFKLKTLILTATDLTGLTKGPLHRFNDTVSIQYDAVSGNDPIDDSIDAKDQPVIEELARAQLGPAEPELVVAAREDAATAAAPEKNAAAAATLPPPERNEVATATVPPREKKPRRKPVERKVPSAPLSRFFGFAAMGAGLTWGTFEESSKRIAFGAPQNNQNAVSPYLSKKNAERLARALCRMRGAALKLGQILSIQDESLVSAPLLCRYRSCKLWKLSVRALM